MISMYKCREAMYCTTVSQQFGVVSKKKRDTKEDKGKSMMCALYVLRYTKRNIRTKQRRIVKKIKPVAVAVIELHLPEGIWLVGS